MIGMGRAISDGISDAYIQDVVVLKSWRKKGIGGEIIKEIVKRLKESEIDWIALIGEPGTEKFYSGLGFKKMQSYIPMKLD
jgi:spermidine synthase